MPLLHIADEAAWAARADHYAPPSLDTEGFVHLSHPHQIEATANRFYRDLPTLTVLVLSADSTRAHVREEDTTGHGVFPHHYGPIATDAVVRVVRWRRDPDGVFRTPGGWT